MASDLAFVYSARLYLREQPHHRLKIPHYPGPHHDCSTSTSLSDKEAHHITVSPSKSPSTPPRKSTNVTPSSSPMLAIKITDRQPKQVSLQVSGKLSQHITVTIEYPTISPSKSPEQSCNVMIKKTNKSESRNPNKIMY